MIKLTIKSKTYGTKQCFYDERHHSIISKFIWCVVPNRDTFYAMSRVKIGDKKYKTVRMHQLIIKEGQVDHIDGNGLNNLDDNLRSATPQQNNFNVGLTKRNKSGYKGVYESRSGKFVACIRKSGKLIHGGTFKYAKQAAKKYNELATLHHGEFAWLNKV